jgi:hypothetical protein
MNLHALDPSMDIRAEATTGAACLGAIPLLRVEPFLPRCWSK